MWMPLLSSDSSYLQTVRVHAASGLGTPVLMDTVYGSEAKIPADIEATLAGLKTDRERFFLHAASLDIPRYNVSVSAKEPAFWQAILDGLD